MISRIDYLAIALAFVIGLMIFGAAFGAPLDLGREGTSNIEMKPLTTSEEDFFYGVNDQEPVTIALDQIGVLAQQDATADEVESFVNQSYGFELRQTLDDAILLFDLNDSMERADIVLLARDILTQAPELIAQAGLVLPGLDDENGTMPTALATDQFIVQLAENVAEDQLNQLNEANGVRIVMPNPYFEGEYLLTVTEESDVDGLTMANRYHEDDATEFAHANFILPLGLRQTTPNDPLFGNQWHLNNTGTAGGTVDADADLPEAWGITQGSNAVVIAIIDDGFDMAHPDLTPNYHTTRRDFRGCDSPIDTIACGDGNPSPRGDDDHGTSVAGLAAARGNNGIGVSGSCPNCRIMPIRRGRSRWADTLAFDFARMNGAHIISNSWGYRLDNLLDTQSLTAAINRAATNGRNGLGAVIFFAMNNINQDDCAVQDISSLASVIAISASSNQDRKVTESAFGNCMELLAPTHRGYGPNLNGFPAGFGVPYVGTLNVVTTDRSGTAGYNNTNPFSTAVGYDPTRCPTENGDTNYTNCFGGTSAATPLSAGIAGLLLNVKSDLTRLQVQRLLQDTADKIEPSVGAYDAVTGFSAPASGIATHGFGRINAFEAVRVAAPIASGGRGGVDVFIRDNALDWGNTEQPSNVLLEPTRGSIAHYRSVDIKIDSSVNGYQPAPTTSDQFDDLVDESPRSSELNKVYVRVRNRGPVTAAEVKVKLHWAFAGTGLPALPSDFWSAFPADSSDTSQIHPIGLQTIRNLAYSGSSIAGMPGDAAQIVSFDFNAPAFDPSAPNPQHYCLFAVIDSPQDSVSAARATFHPDAATPIDNNVTHRNVALVGSRNGRISDGRFYVRNPLETPITSILRLQLTDPHQDDWRIEIDPFLFDEPFELGPGEEISIRLNVELPNEEVTGEFEIVQEYLEENGYTVLGGLVYNFAPSVKSQSETQLVAQDGLSITLDGSTIYLPFFSQ
ncbi:S8 family serine peptidase [Chloroflexi bacterium TSY]|nr:S8 family serine peptidase [Chloroflexi bacterium TSY]